MEEVAWVNRESKHNKEISLSLWPSKWLILWHQTHPILPEDQRQPCLTIIDVVLVWNLFQILVEWILTATEQRGKKSGRLVWETERRPREGGKAWMRESLLRYSLFSWLMTSSAAVASVILFVMPQNICCLFPFIPFLLFCCFCWPPEERQTIALLVLLQVMPRSSESDTDSIVWM